MGMVKRSERSERSYDLSHAMLCYRREAVVALATATPATCPLALREGRRITEVAYGFATLASPLRLSVLLHSIRQQES